MTDFAYLIPVFPLIAFAINLFFGRRLGGFSGWISVLTSIASSAIALPAAWAVAQGGQYSREWLWLTLGNYDLNFGYLLDPLSATLLFVVTIIGTLIQVYSIGYMHGEKYYHRFFAYVSLFMAAMLALVIANNYVQFFMAWEVMGLCSYLLIGFYFHKDSAANASRKAFLTTRVGDVGLFLGIMTLLVTGGTLSFTDLPNAIQAGTPLLWLAAPLIFCGTIGKSAQFPLHVWLPDAMEGPTPVSALIHAATMVAAGVYLVARSFVLFTGFPVVMPWVMDIGTLTAFMAAYIALTATDIKKVLAFSTISQLGYMVTAMGLGGMTAGTFHLMTHAFFKALLFLGAGSVIHGAHEQDIRELGGLFSKMKQTGATFVIASLAIAGIPPLSGFWSKDEILLEAYQGGHFFVYGVLLLTAFMTAFYMFRLVFLTFFGKPRNPDIHAHESPVLMTLPLWCLAIGAIGVGIPGSPFMDHWFQGFLSGGHHGGEINGVVMGSSIAAGVLGIGLAAVLYLVKPQWPVAIATTFRPLYLLSVHQFWIDDIYSILILNPFQGLGEFLFGFDRLVVDGLVNSSVTVMQRMSQIQLWIDRNIVDSIVNLTGRSTVIGGDILKLFQTGSTQFYLLITCLSVLAFLSFELTTGFQELPLLKEELYGFSSFILDNIFPASWGSNYPFAP
jgi:NADH-quinone oxidoreductase subunit L